MFVVRCSHLLTSRLSVYSAFAAVEGDVSVIVHDDGAVDVRVVESR